jgi:site-specific DNA-cytosine methylase
MADFRSQLRRFLTTLQRSQYRAIVLEDVPGLLQPRHHQLFNEVCCLLLDCERYRWAAGLLDAHHFDSADSRNRIFFVALRINPPPRVGWMP